MTECQKEYVRLSAKIEAQIQELQQKLKEHAAAAASSPTNWGYVGDLTAYTRELSKMLGQEG